MTETLVLANATRKEIIRFFRVAASTPWEIASNPASAAIVAKYMTDHIGDTISFVSSYDDKESPFPDVTAREVEKWPDVTDTVVQELLKERILVDRGKIFYFDDEKEIWDRDLRNNWSPGGVSPKLFFPLPFDLLIELFERGARKWAGDGMYSTKPPSIDSVDRINRELNIVLPSTYIEFATKCSGYGVCFAGIGGDYDADNHILNINRRYREIPNEECAPLPSQCVAIELDTDCHSYCLDRLRQDANGELPVVLVSLLDETAVIDGETETFLEHLQKQCIYMAKDPDLDPRSKPRS